MTRLRSDMGKLAKAATRRMLTSMASQVWTIIMENMRPEIRLPTTTMDGSRSEITVPTILAYAERYDCAAAAIAPSGAYG